MEQFDTAALFLHAGDVQKLAQHDEPPLRVVLVEEEREGSGKVCIIENHAAISDGSHILRDLGISLHIRTLKRPTGENQPATEDHGGRRALPTASASASGR